MDCGNYYGSKVWHSNTKYRRVIWRCNHKYDDDKCQTTHFTEDEIEEMFITATNQLVEMKVEVMRNYSEMNEILFGTTELESEQGKLEDEINEVASLIEDCVNENARIVLDQADYEKRYNALVTRFDKSNSRLEEVKEQMFERQAKGMEVEQFLKELDKVGFVEKFDEELFLGLIEVVEVSREKRIVRFKDGSEIEV